MYMAIEAFRHKRKWITLFTLSYMGYSATVVYRFCITLEIFESGYFSTLIFSPQLGFVLFIGIALLTVIATYVHRVQVLETVTLATTSLESISDVERMVEQINFYINTENITQKATPVSMKVHIESLCNLYKIACIEKHITFQLITQTVMIQGLAFDRIMTIHSNTPLKVQFQLSVQ